MKQHCPILIYGATLTGIGLAYGLGERAYVMEGGTVKRALNRDDLSDSASLHQEFLGGVLIT